MKFGLTIRSHDKVLLKSFLQKLKSTWSEIDGSELSVIGLPIKKKRYTILRSPHVDKKSRDQWEIRKHSYYCQIQNENEKQIQYILDYILRHIPGGIGVVLHRYQKVHFEMK